MSRTAKSMDPDASQSLAESFAKYHGFEICREPWDLYYDETENCRSISYRDGSLRDTRTVEKDFILGGIVVTDPRAIPDLLEGCAELPSPSGEVKCKPVLGGSSDFRKVLRRREVAAFLDLIDRPGVVVHYHAQDNLYYSIVDIVDSVISLPGHEHMAAWDRELKNALFLCACQDRVGFLNALAGFGFPNVASGEVESFCNYIADLLASMLELDPGLGVSQNGFFVETLRQMMRTARRVDQLVFLDGSDEGMLVKGFSEHYQVACMLLPEATHHFDEETHVSMKLVESLGNFEFLKSESSPLIQLSDVWVGLLSRLFRFLDEQDEGSIPSRIDFAIEQQLENLRTIKRLIDRADSTHRSLLSNFNAGDVIWRRDRALDLLCDG